ncbi:MAG TPA: peptide-methionine (S)-S-oxide reductase MsrA [Capsulimonadaceae bacterium]|nr:peptide-methionine (S)-S-oxide reductase MsrA [Capsulimonadaceae bacterium]
MLYPNRSKRLGGGIIMAAALVALVFTLMHSAMRVSAQQTQAETGPAPAGKAVATFAAGCFWRMEAIFKQLKGVERVDPGYAGGTMPHPSYEQVEMGDTGYAESVNIIYDPKVISYRRLLQVLLTVRDPTTLNRQGPDVGTNYRSAIFYRNADQERAAKQAIRQITAQHVWHNPIVTTVVPFTTFYRAEDYHMNYYALHPDEPYCRYVIAPEIARFRQMYHSELKS